MVPAACCRTTLQRVGAWVLFGLSTMTLVGYVALLVMLRRSTAVRSGDLRYLRTPVLAPELVLRRSANF